MGFLDKAMKAAAVAKDQIDDVRATREATGAKPVDAAPLSEHEQGVLARARALGAPDPTMMLSQPEAAACRRTAGSALAHLHRRRDRRPLHRREPQA